MCWGGGVRDREREREKWSKIGEKKSEVLSNVKEQRLKVDKDFGRGFWSRGTLHLQAGGKQPGEIRKTWCVSSKK